MIAAVFMAAVLFVLQHSIDRLLLAEDRQLVEF